MCENYIWFGSIIFVTITEFLDYDTIFYKCSANQIQKLIKDVLNFPLKSFLLHFWLFKELDS